MKLLPENCINCGCLLILHVYCFATQQNVLFIAIDDLKPTLGCYGDQEILSPEIDRLADRGTVFLRNYCQQAVCGPTRASLLTGLYPDENHTWGFTMIREAFPDILTLPQYFRQNGYTTVNISKIFDYRTVDEKWDGPSWTRAFPSGEQGLEPYYPGETGEVTGYFYHSPLVKSVWKEIVAADTDNKLSTGQRIQQLHKRIKPATECLDIPDNAYKDGVFALRAIEELEGLAKEDKPFFLGVGFERPHLPFTAPKKYWDLYDPEKIKLAQFQEHAEGDQDWFYTRCEELRSYTARDGSPIFEKLSDGKSRLNHLQQIELVHGYMAAVSFIDAQVGKILAKLHELGLSEQTLVVIWGDHGYHLGDHGLWGKATNFEQATWSPLIIAAPGYKPHKVSTPTGFIDVFPTLCDLSGLAVPEHLSGHSLKALMSGAGSLHHRYAVSQYTRRDNIMGYAVRDGRYRYVEWIEDALHVNPDSLLDKVTGRQLFDYQTDPLETDNLADDPELVHVQRRLAGYLREHLLQLMGRSANAPVNRSGGV